MGIKDKEKFIFLAIAPTGEGISGSDRIFIELARQWAKRLEIDIVTTEEGVKMCRRQKLKGKHLKITSIDNSHPSGFLAKYVKKIYLGIKYGLKTKIKNPGDTILYSSSDFWMDVFPAVILKIRYKEIKWLATWYQTAPNPIKGFQEAKRDKGYKLSAFLYWFTQLPVKPLIKNYADWVIVNNEDERGVFPELNKKGRTIVLIGAVRLDQINRYKKKYKNEKKTIDCVFQGRFHPQKGVVELVEIWNKVVQKKPRAKLAMIGDGPLMNDVRNKVEKLGLDKNIDLLGYVFDGDKKYKTFARSKMVAHPAYYDSGGMASAEAMAFGLPVVGFNLKAYKSYYKKGMVKVKKGDKDKFADAILKLLSNTRTRKKVGKEALEMIKSYWSWDYRANEIVNNL